LEVTALEEAALAEHRPGTATVRHAGELQPLVCDGLAADLDHADAPDPTKRRRDFLRIVGAGTG
jgi:hypothetical protein